MADEFELSILDSGDPGRAIAIARAGHDLAIEPLSCQQLRKLSDFRALLAAAADGAGKRPSDAELLEFGRLLFEFLLIKKISQIYVRLPASHIRLHIYSNRADVQSLPWEYMQQPDTPPGPNSLRTVVRIVPTIGVDPPAPAALGKKVRMLFVYAEPSDQVGVAWSDIKATIEREFRSRMPGSLEITLVEGATRQSLFDALDQASFDVLHFAGHGEIAADGTGTLLLRDIKTGKTDALSATDLGMLLRNKGLRLVVLSACSTSAGDFAKEFAVLAQTLVEYGVPAVVANQFPVTNSIAAKFATAFYRELLRSGDVDKATTNGRVALALEPALRAGAARFEWGTPTLYRHIAAATVFTL